MRSFHSFNQRHLFVVATMCASFATLASCGGDDDDTTGGAGTGGSAARGGSGGTGGKGGAAGTAGKGGAAGTAGKGGAAGTAGKGGSGGGAGTGATGGTAGTAGKGGSAGTGGTAGKGGTGGAAGAAGKGGTAGTVPDAGPDAGPDASIDASIPDASVDADAATTTANLRVAHLSPGTPAVDFCLAVHGTTAFTGPVLAGRGALTGIPYGSVTQYLVVGAAQYDVRLVAAGATSCAASLNGLPDVTNLPVLASGSSATIAAEGELAPGDAGGQPFGVRAYVDDTTLTAGKTKLRFVHASSGTPAVDVGLGGGALFTPLFTNIAFGNTATAANGYIESDPLTNVEISARPNGTASDVLAIRGASLAAGTIATAFAIGKIGNIVTPLKVLLCADNGPPVGMLAACNILGDVPQRAHVRVAHLSPDAPTIDVCLTPTGTTFGGAPVLRRLGGTTGVSYPQATTYLELPVASYTVRLVLATATDCLTPAVPDTMNVVVTNGLYATVAALGDLMVPDAGAADAGTDPAFALKVFVDNSGAPVPPSNIGLRFVHASPGTGPVDVGLGSAGTFTTVFGNVAFGNVAIGAGIDLNGYVSTGPFASQTISVRAAGGTIDVLVVPNVTIPAGSLATAFAIGNKTGDVTKPLRVLLCTDSAIPAGLFTPCTALP